MLLIIQKNPNSVTKKYYNFISDLPLFIPDKKIAHFVVRLLDKYPVTPYLDSKKSFVKWMHFFHNKINDELNKPQLTISEFYDNYYENYKSDIVIVKDKLKFKLKYIYLAIITIIIILIAHFYNK